MAKRNPSSQARVEEPPPAGGRTKVRFKVALVAPDWSYAPRHEYDIDSDWATKLASSGIVEIVRRGLETATPPKPETPEGA